MTHLIKTRPRFENKEVKVLFRSCDFILHRPIEDQGTKKRTYVVSLLNVPFMPKNEEFYDVRCMTLENCSLSHAKNIVSALSTFNIDKKEPLENKEFVEFIKNNRSY